MSSSEDIEPGNHYTKQKEISPVESRLGNTRNQTKEIRERIRRDSGEYVCHTDTELDLVLTDKRDTRYVMQTSTPQRLSSDQVNQVRDPLIPNIQTTTAAASSMIQSRVSH